MSKRVLTVGACTGLGMAADAMFPARRRLLLLAPSRQRPGETTVG